MNDEIKKLLNPKKYTAEPYSESIDAGWLVDEEDFEALKRGFLKLMEQRGDEIKAGLINEYEYDIEKKNRRLL